MLVSKEIIASNKRKIIPASFCRLVRVNEKIHPAYAYYWLQEMYMSGRAGNYELRSTGISNFQFEHFLDAEFVRLPNLDEQIIISQALKNIDDRIELLRQTNTTLESIAQALFKSWFIDFDPVRAKMEGRQPEGMDAETAALFPDELVQSELGEIPKGWSFGCLGDVINQRCERAKPGLEVDRLPYIPIECITSKSIFITDFKPGSEAQSSLTYIREGDIVFGAMRPYFHKVALAATDGVTRTTVFVLKPKSKNHQIFCLFSLFLDETVEFATNHSVGTTIPYAKWSDSLEKKELIIPDESTLQAFQQTTETIVKNGINNAKKIETLKDLRDTLLPKLMSGQLRVQDVDGQV